MCTTTTLDTKVNISLENIIINISSLQIIQTFERFDITVRSLKKSIDSRQGYRHKEKIYVMSHVATHIDLLGIHANVQDIINNKKSS